MTKFLYPFICAVTLTTIAFGTCAQDAVGSDEKSAAQKNTVTERSEEATAVKKIQSLSALTQAQSKEDKEMEAYRKRQVAGGLILELDSRLAEVRPYVRSMLNSCGYVLVSEHRFAKRVYPTLVVDGQMFNGLSDGEHSVTLDLSLVLKSKTREIKERGKMRSYRTSELNTHRALFAAFEDVGAQMKSNGYCVGN